MLLYEKINALTQQNTAKGGAAGPKAGGPKKKWQNIYLRESM